MLTLIKKLQCKFLPSTWNIHWFLQVYKHIRHYKVLGSTPTRQIGMNNILNSSTFALMFPHGHV